MAEKNRKVTAKKKIILKIIVGVTTLAALILWSGGFFKSKLPPGEVKAQTGIPIPDEVKTFKVESKPVAPRIDLVGTVASGEKILLSARTSAYVKRIFASAGDRVREGQTLVRLDNRELKERLAAAEAGLQQAEIEYERTQKLIAADATTDQALTAAKSAFETARAQVQQIKVMLTFTEIKSPIDGKVTDRRIEAGDLANAGQVLLGVFAPQNMRIEVPVPVRLVEKLQLGQIVEIELDRPARPFTGKVTEVVGEVDPMSRTQRVKVHIDGVSTDVLPGTFGRIWISDDPRPAILVPASAVYKIGQLEMVQVIKGNTVIRRLVKTGPRYGDMIEILSGLSDNDMILIEPIKG
ncbi:MAG: efflux RND transporter periplasmic adaptor subunit [Deltaproteobacteria bacterium]|nr:MAG: efflux RND transporter periplasmic adaptor subunit [Deltaproteobacteria bacterium]